MSDGEIESVFYREFGRKLAAKRKHRGFSQESLAAELGVHRNTVCRWERGESPIDLWVLLRLADLLSCQHLMLLPAREFTWGGPMVRRMQVERDPASRIQQERDPQIWPDEERRLREAVA